MRSQMELLNIKTNDDMKVKLFKKAGNICHVVSQRLAISDPIEAATEACMAVNKIAALLPSKYKYNIKAFVDQHDKNGTTVTFTLTYKQELANPLLVEMNISESFKMACHCALQSGFYLRSCTNALNKINRTINSRYYNYEKV